MINVEYGYISHHGIKGQKWGIRRYQNENGSYTSEGLKRKRNEYSRTDTSRKDKRFGSDASRLSNDELYGKTRRMKAELDYRKTRDEFVEYNNKGRNAGRKALKIIGTTTATSAAILGLVKTGFTVFEKMGQYGLLKGKAAATYRMGVKIKP